MFNFFSRKAKEPIEFCFNTDIHCHIVPGVDDGSPDAKTSGDLVERMQKWGIKRIFASPHVTQYTFENSPETIEPAMAELKAELDARGNGIEVGHSAEYRIDDLFSSILGKGNLMTLPGNYLLIENPFVQEPWNLDELVFDLQVKGFRPILAHPERYLYWANKKKRYVDLHHAGLMFQINILSLAKAYGKEECKIAEYLIKEGMASFAGTDLHRASHADIIDKYLTGSEARAHMADLGNQLLNDTAF